MGFIHKYIRQLHIYISNQLQNWFLIILYISAASFSHVIRARSIEGMCFVLYR